LREYVYLGHQPVAVITNVVDKGASTGPGNGAGKGIGKPDVPSQGPGHGKGTPLITAPGVPAVPQPPAPVLSTIYKTLPLHVPLCPPYRTGHVSKSGSRKHQGRFAMRK